MATLHSQYHACWWPGDVMSHGLSNHDIDLVKPGKLGPRTLRFNPMISNKYNLSSWIYSRYNVCHSNLVFDFNKRNATANWLPCVWNVWLHNDEYLGWVVFLRLRSLRSSNRDSSSDTGHLWPPTAYGRGANDHARSEMATVKSN